MSGDKARVCVAFRRHRVALYAERAAQGRDIFTGEPHSEEELERERQERFKEREETRTANDERRRREAVAEGNRRRKPVSAAMAALMEAFIRHGTGHK
jgi:hypothetical protein